jgi:hypothetical protein
MFVTLAIALIVAVIVYRRIEDAPPSKDIAH